MMCTDKIYLWIICGASLLAMQIVACPRDTNSNNSTEQNLRHISKETFISCERSSMGSLDLAHREISFIANGSFDGFRQLRLLNLSHNKLVLLHREMLTGLESIKVLDISFNQLLQLSAGLLELLPNIHYLNSSHNRIVKIASDVFNTGLWYLKYVDLSHNNLTYFEPWPYILPYNNKFDLQHNQIRKMTNLLDWQYNIREPFDTKVDLRYNNFTKWNEIFFGQYHRGNNFSVGNIYSFMMDLRHNPWTCDCNFFSLSKLFHSSFYQFVKQPTSTNIANARCQSPAKFKEKLILIDLTINDFVCNISVGCPKGCLCQELPAQKIIFVDCAGLGLRELPLNIPKNKYNRLVLNLTDNNIITLQYRTYLKTIINLYVSKNNLEYIDDDVMGEMKRIQFLDVRNNRLKFLPRTLSSLLEFDNIIIDDNPLVCACNVTWMARWVQQRNANLSSPFCATNLDTRIKISELSAERLECSKSLTVVAVGITLGLLLLLFISLAIAAKKCPYETKVIMFSCMRIHPSNKYAIDYDHSVDNQIYISFDEEDQNIVYWVLHVLYPKLQNLKQYRVFIPVIHTLPGDVTSDDRADNLKNSKRIVIILSEGYFCNEWNLFETQQAALLEPLENRMVFVLFDNESFNLSQYDPWESRMSSSRVLSVKEKLFWSKLKYELPAA